MTVNIFSILILLAIYLIVVLTIYKVINFAVTSGLVKDNRKNKIWLKIFFLIIILIMTIPIIGFIVS